jgi:hypothetical protein
MVLDLYNVPEASPCLPALEAAASSRGWAAVREKQQPSPAIRLPGDWEAYLASLEKKQRHELRRKMRRAENNAAPIRFHIVGPEEDLEAATERFLQLMAFEVDKTGFLTPAMRAHFHSAVRAAAKRVTPAFSSRVRARRRLSRSILTGLGIQLRINPEHTALSPGCVAGVSDPLGDRARRSEFDFCEAKSHKRQPGSRPGDLPARSDTARPDALARVLALAEAKSDRLAPRAGDRPGFPSPKSRPRSRRRADEGRAHATGGPALTHSTIRLSASQHRGDTVEHTLFGDCSTC